VVRWLKEQSHKATIEQDKAHLRWLDPHLGGKKLEQINRHMVDRLTEVKLAEGVSNATVNRLLEIVRAILRRSVNRLATGLRRANVTGLQWTQVDLVRRLAWIHPAQAKARKAIAVPLNADAVAIIRRQLGKHSTHVFCFRGKPTRQVIRKLGIRRSSAPVSKAFAGTIFGTPGLAGTCRTERRSLHCRSWADGKVRRWCGGTRTSRLII